MPRKARKQQAMQPIERLRSPALTAQADRFVEGLLMGFSRFEAGLYAGTRARSKVDRLWRDPYTQARFRELREKLTRDQICSFAEQALDVKSMAFDDRLAPTSRISAHSLLARLMGHEKAPSGGAAGGIMLVPMAPQSMQAWEAVASAQQARLAVEVTQ